MSTKSSSKADSGTPHNDKITFKCRLCGKDKPVEDMRTVTRFNPLLVVCRNCARTLQ